MRLSESGFKCPPHTNKGYDNKYSYRGDSVKAAQALLVFCRLAKKLGAAY